MAEAQQTLLIADDDELLRALLAATLADDRYRLIEASNGTDAMNLVREQRPQAAVLDLNMPGLDGIEVCKQIRGDLATRNCFIVMLTGSDEPADRERALGAGANTYLTKPFSPLELMELIDSTLGAPLQQPGLLELTLPRSESIGFSMAAFMFADIRDFTRFTIEHGDETAFVLVREFQHLLRQHRDANAGREVTTAGDNMLIAFPTARQAVKAAIGFMKTVTAYNQAEPPHRLDVGVGIDVGEPVQNEGDFIGAALNRAARITARAAPGEVLVTSTVRDLAGAIIDGEYAIRDLGELRGIDGPNIVFRIVWDG
ncbi:MAG: response regulator, partial [Chloroflexota bacterium]